MLQNSVSIFRVILGSRQCTVGRARVPFHKKGRSIMFDKKEIDQWLQSGSHYKSQQEIEDEARSFIESKKKNNIFR